MGGARWQLAIAPGSETPAQAAFLLLAGVRSWEGKLLIVGDDPGTTGPETGKHPLNCPSYQDG